MPSFGIIDTHLHLWDPARISYSWQKGNTLLERPYCIEDYQRDTQGLDIEAMVFLECHVDGGPGMGQYIKEIEFVEEESRRDPRIRGIVAKAPLERGHDVEALLDEMVMRFPTLRGIRRIPEFEPDAGAFMLSTKFIEGVRLLPRYDLHFELNVNYTQMDAALEFVDRVPKVSVILDHCGKPGIKGGHIEHFRRHMKAMAARPNVVCKLSGLTVEANWGSWSNRDMRPFIEATLAAFGTERVLYGGDWPICLQATTLQRWVACLDGVLGELSETQLRRIYRENADEFYRLGLSPAPLLNKERG